MRNRGLASQETSQEHMSIVKYKIFFQHQAPIRKTNTFSTCFYTSFLSCDFPFCIDSLHTCLYSHLDFHTTPSPNRNRMLRLLHTRTQIWHGPHWWPTASSCISQDAHQFQWEELSPQPGNGETDSTQQKMGIIHYGLFTLHIIRKKKKKKTTTRKPKLINTKFNFRVKKSEKTNLAMKKLKETRMVAMIKDRQMVKNP